MGYYNFEFFSDTQPIILIKANNSSARAQSCASERFKNLPNVFHCCVGAKVVLTYNIWPEAGLSNGSTGIVKDFVFVDGQRAPDFPYCVWVDFSDEYCGLAFFGEADRAKWVPIYPVSIEDHV